MKRSLALLYLVGVVVGMTNTPVLGQGIELVPSDSNWLVYISDYGYSDNLWDQRSGVGGREYLSGEWGAAIGYNAAGPIWMEPNFIYPDWTTNSNFSVDTGVHYTDGSEGSQYHTSTSSTISNGTVSIQIDSQMINTTTGIALGLTPAGDPGSGASVTSDKHILKQTYTITNQTASALNNVTLYQFAHGLRSTKAIYDDRDYIDGGAYDGYRYAITQTGSDATAIPDGQGGFVSIDDTITFLSNVQPDGFEVGYYGKEGVDNHGIGKPSVGVHLSIESGTLNGTDAFDPSNPAYWVSGAMNWNLGSLNANGQAGDTATFDVLLTIHSTDVPEPASVILLGLSGMVLLRRRR